MSLPLSAKSVAAKMPAGLDTGDAVYKALFGDAEAAPQAKILCSADFNEGAFCNEADYLKLFIKKIAQIRNIEELDGPYLDLLALRFCGLKRFAGESGAGFSRRLLALSARGGFPRRMAKQAVIEAFKYFFSAVYVVEADAQDNLLANGAFAEGLAGWRAQGPLQAVSACEEAFCGANYIELGFGGLLSQEIGLPAGWHSLYFFVQGDCQLDAQGDAALGLRVQEARPSSGESGGPWRLLQAFISLQQAGPVQISLQAHGAAKAGLAVCGPYKGFPSFKVYLKPKEGSGGQGFWGPGALDQSGGAYYGQDFFLAGDSAGINSVYFDFLLGALKGAGIQAGWEILR